MFLLLFLFIYVISPITSSVVADRDNKCSGNEFTCRDGACIDLSSLCDGRQNCVDGSDEAVCDGRTSDLNFAWNTVSSRARRQATCQKNQWQCRDGTCIGFDGKCDGVVDCPDGSDETHPLCRSSRCQSNWFRCTYGACVDGSAPCNGIKECADNSDELLPRCRNNTDVVAGQFKCENGEMISSASLCDGVTDCSDGSDETVRACAGNTCYSYLFQCAYGACVDQGSDCNGKQECADGSDESPELCNKSGVDVKPLPSDNNNNNSNNTPRPSTPQVGNCILPEYPENGQWVAPNERFASPGKSYKQIYLQYSCNIGYQLQGAVDVTCIDGQFIQEIPKCVRLCHINRHASIDYYCYSANGVDGRRPCNDYEPQGTIARPQCKVNYYYYYGGDPQPMTCSAGGWSDYPICSPGLTKNGTNITIIIKDKVEVHIGSFLYTAPNVNQPVTGNFNDKIFFNDNVRNKHTVININDANNKFGGTNKKTGSVNNDNDKLIPEKGINKYNDEESYEDDIDETFWRLGVVGGNVNENKIVKPQDNNGRDTHVRNKIYFKDQ